MNKTYCFSDLHGNYNIWQGIKNFLDDTDTAYCLGDNNDRGKNGIKIIREILEDDRIIYLKGNHEQLLVDWLHTTLYKKGLVQDKCNIKFDNALWDYNGGQETKNELYEIWQNEGIEVLVDLYNKLKNLPIIETYFNKKINKLYVLTHSGFGSYHTNNLSKIKKTNNHFLFLENRKHIYEIEWKGPKNVYMVHGHTPVQAMQTNFRKELPPFFYCNKHKIDIDVCTILTNMAILFDLDELHPHYFKD